MGCRGFDYGVLPSRGQVGSLQASRPRFVREVSSALGNLPSPHPVRFAHRPHPSNEGREEQVAFVR